MEQAQDAAQPQQEPIIIRYEGKLAEGHEIELMQLGESLQGFGKALAVAANYAHTGKPALHYDALDVRIVARPTPEHHCFEVWSFIKTLAETKEFWIAGMGAGATLMAPVVAYIFSKRNTEEMKHLSEALKQSMAGNQSVTDRLVSTVEKLAEALNPSVRKALAPIDRSCSHIDIFAGPTKIQSMDATTKAAFAAGRTKIADHSKIFRGLISEFDMSNGGCKVQLEGEDERVTAKVVDPVFSEPNNPYVSAMASKAYLSFLAKYEADQDGKLVKLHIFDTAEEA